ncbi:PREDICTED: fibrinogen-like protein 1 isoform X2 [Branchiostoma belcheri]|uniref:Fibrinogen-like protein 1 isoform X2 n=1 Tax=Branchiostoma belcheri TaxID=7741 RepID=A0A6P5AWN0_BRABE|nr:PREDICTED: fibrinogen-like protein 1 isoform X2 [Branchiostoma belcheri]
MSSKKLFPNGEAAREGSVGRHGNRRTNGIVLALSGLAAVVSVVTLLFVGRELTFLRAQQEILRRVLHDQQAALYGDLRDQQGRDHDQLVLLRSQLQDLMQGKQELGAKTSEQLSPEGPASSTEDWRRDDSATFWKSAEVHHRSKREAMANTVLFHGKFGGLGCPSGAPGRDGRDGLQGPAGPPGPPGQCCIERPTPSPEVATTPGAVQASDCADLYAAGQTTSGVYNIRLGSSNVETYCDMDTAGGGWTVIQRRQDGSVPFNRTWEEYKHGFGNKNGEYWLGNENIHLLTSQKNYTLRVDLEDWEEETRYATYSSFRVSGESDQYRLHISGYSGDAGDSMAGGHTLNGQRFSTVDRDNDVHSSLHCSQALGQAGWWFGICSWSNLNGRYLRNCKSSCPLWQGVLWNTWIDLRYSLKSVSMKIKP